MAEFDVWAGAPRYDAQEDSSLGFEADELRKAWQEWSRQAAAGVPPRSAFTARGTKSFVAHLVIFERRDGGFFVRLMGTRVSAVIGEMQGKMIDETLPPEIAKRWALALSDVLHHRKPKRIVQAVAFRNLNFLEAEILLAPLCDEQGVRNMVFSVVTFRSGVKTDHPLEKIIAGKGQNNPIGGPG